MDKRRKKRNRKTQLIYLIGTGAIIAIMVTVAILFNHFYIKDQDDLEKQDTLSDIWFNLLRPNISNNEEDTTIDSYVPYQMVEEIFPSMDYNTKMNTPYPVGDIYSFFQNQISHENSEARYLGKRLISGDTVPYDGKERSITCWGDSMTEGNGTGSATIDVDGEEKDISYSTFPSVLGDLTGIQTYNLGVGGETSIQIAQREGGLKMVTDREINIPKSGAVRFNLMSAEYEIPVDINDYSGYGQTEERYLNHVYINDKMYKLTYNGDSHMVYKKLNHKIKKKDQDSVIDNMADAITDAISSVNVPAGTQVYTAASIDRKNDILIIEMGSNGGWDDFEELIRQYDSMIAFANCDYYIILGDTDDPNYVAGLGDTPWEAALRKAYGDHFLNMRTYLIKNALKDCGLTTTYADIECAYNGQISKQIRADWTHLNAYGYYSKGLAVYQKGVELGYWN